MPTARPCVPQRDVICAPPQRWILPFIRKDRRRRRELKAKSECRACCRKGHWARDREGAMSPSSSSSQNQTRTARMTTQQHLCNQAKQVGMCFVLKDYINDSDTSAYMVGQNVPLPTESARQTLLTPITASAASAAVDTKKGGILSVHAMDDDDEPWLSETDQETGWNKGFKSGTYRGMLCWIVLRGYPKQVVSLAKAKSVPGNMREFLSWAQRHYRIDVTASTVQRTTFEPASVGPCPGGCKDFTQKGSKARFIRVTCKVCGTVRIEDRHPPRQDPASCSHRHESQEKQCTHEKDTLR